MFAIVQGGHVCELCGGKIEPLMQMREAGWGSPEIWEYQCARCGSLQFSEVTPEDMPLVPQSE
jgi:DNA-directed RNA polymerase subunit RPC12/RpoP